MANRRQIVGQRTKRRVKVSARRLARNHPMGAVQGNEKIADVLRRYGLAGKRQQKGAGDRHGEHEHGYERRASVPERQEGSAALSHRAFLAWLVALEESRRSPTSANA